MGIIRYKENPIIISGNENNYGGGIYIYNNFENNVIKNTYFENLSGTKYINSSEKINLEYLKKFNLMGSVNFYNVKLNLEHIYFNKIFSEDALNIVSSNNFKLKNIYFNKIKSDALDVDFSTGDIEDIYSKEINNDAIDFSKSNVNLKNIFADRIGDKIISAGENSKIKVYNLNGKNSYIGVASKDGSKVYLKKFKLKDNKYHFASYIKKNGYKPSSIEIYDIKTKFANDKILKDKESKIYFDKAEYKISTKNSLILKEIYN